MNTTAASTSHTLILGVNVNFTSLLYELRKHPKDYLTPAKYDVVDVDRVAYDI